MKKIRLSFSLLLFSFITNSLFASPNACPEFPYLNPKRGAIAHLNCDMHKAYEERILQIISSFGAVNGRPIILNLGSLLILKYNGKQKTVHLTPKTYHEIKAFCHGALSVFLILSQQKEGRLNEQSIKALTKLGDDFRQSQSLLTQLALSARTHSIIQKLIKKTSYFIQITLKTKQWSNSSLDSYYYESKILIDQLIDAAALIELNLLNKTINAWLQQMTPQEKKKIGIAVATVHQARANELSVQYFMKKFNKEVDIGAKKENGMVVVENNFDENAVLKQLARNYLDREIGGFIFANPGRLQEDVLSESTKKRLENGCE